MSYRTFLPVFLLSATVSTGFAQTLADVARAERARREAIPPIAAFADPGAIPLGREAMLKEAVHVAGARRLLEQVLQSALQSSEVDEKTDAFTKEEFREIIQSAFATDHLMTIFEKFLADSVTDKTLTDVLSWYRSPLGKKIALAELNAQGAAKTPEMQRFAATLTSNPPSSNRMRLVHGLEEQTQAAVRTGNALLAIVMAVHKGMTAAGIRIPPPPPDFEDFFRTQVTAPLRQGMTVWMLYAYRSVSENELLSYQAFMKTPSAVAFNDSIWNAMTASFSEGAQQFGKLVAEKTK
jgi:hypothetical protein